MKRIETLRGVYAQARSLGGRVRACFRSWNEEGQALVEFAVSLPILLLIVTGIITFGIALNNYLELTDATSIGARQLAISRNQTLDPCNTAATAVQNAAPFLKATNFTFSFIFYNTNGTSVLGSTSGSSCSSTSSTTGYPADLVQGGSVQVTVQYPCNLSVYGVNYAPHCQLTAQTTELVQ